MLQSTDKLKLEINKIIKNEFDNVELKKSLNQSLGFDMSEVATTI